MRGGVLLVSRHANLLPFYKTFFEGIGFRDVHTTGKEKDGLNMVINELKPRNIFIESSFYSIATPYMVGLLHKKFRKINITAVTTDDFPDNMAVWFLFHGAKSYVNLLDSVDELKKGLIQIRNGENYISHSVQDIINKITEWPECNSKVTKRQKEILFMICNGYSRERIGEQLHIARTTICFHIQDLLHKFHVHSKEE
jgi:DNA-binding NarL/FixJ family response regulator